MDSGIFRPLQEAAVQALSAGSEWTVERNRIYQERLEILLGGLSEAGLAPRRPRATLYVWTRVPPPSEEYALALLRSTGVAVAPGSFFGTAGEEYVRLSITAPAARIQEAMERVRQFAGQRTAPSG
jgi:LL-diaminopimelate aminotransferase